MIKFISENLFTEVLVNPASFADSIKIVSGYATPSMVSTHMEEIRGRIKVELIVGMTPFDGISLDRHKAFTELVKFYEGRFQCFYVNVNNRPIHSTIYCWFKEGKPILAFTGSANYTQSAFFGRQMELLSTCDEMEASKYYISNVHRTVDCFHPDVEIFCHDRGKIDRVRKLESKKQVELPLYSLSQGRMHERAGLNWGQRVGREPNQAYIAVPKKVARRGFFPPKTEWFSLFTDDEYSFECKMAGDSDVCGKQIETPKDNSILGRYFRSRLGVELGKPITLEDLERYGRVDITITKLDENDYYLDFSLPDLDGK